MYPDELRYADTHEWVKEEGSAVVSVGITEYAVGELSDIIFLDLPQEGMEVSKGSPFGAIESVKAVFDLHSPVSGKVIEVNSPLSETPEVVTEDPYNEGWMVKIKLGDPEELGELISAEEYSKMLEEED